MPDNFDSLDGFEHSRSADVVVLDERARRRARDQDVKRHSGDGHDQDSVFFSAFKR